MINVPRPRRPNLDSLLRDFRIAIRALQKRPATVAVAVGVLALGIGASTTIYDTGRALASHAVPFPNPEQLATVEALGDRGRGLPVRYGDVLAWDGAASELLAIGAYRYGTVLVGDGTRTFRVSGVAVSDGFFVTLGITATMGRVFSPADSPSLAEPAIVVTERLWKERFAADSAVVGKTLSVYGRAHTVAGVIPTGLGYPPGVDTWTLLGQGGTGADTLRVSAVLRTAGGVTTQQAATALTTIQSGLDRSLSSGEPVERVAVAPMSGLPGGTDRIALILVQVAVLLLLVITSTNAGGLLLTRALERRRDIAIRTALGAGRGSIVRPLVIESGLIALAASAIGLGGAHVALRWLREGAAAQMGRNIMGWEGLRLDAGSVWFAVSLAALIGLALGVWPALRAMRGDLPAHLREGAPRTGGRHKARLANLLIGGEVALALTLLVVAGLLTRSLLGLVSADPGFDPEGIVTASWAVSPEQYPDDEALVQLGESLRERIGTLSGVSSVEMASALPMSGSGMSREYRVLGSNPDAEAPSANWRSVTPDFFSTLRVPLTGGRSLQAADVADSPPVAVVSRSLVERHWPGGENPVGQQLEMDGRAWTVVGVTGDVNDFGAERAASSTVYVPQAQAPSHSGFLAVRLAGDPAPFVPRVRQEIWALDPDIAVGETNTFPAMVEDFYAGQRILALLMIAFAIFSVLITVASLFTLVTHSVARRGREFGIRLTLGARPRQITTGVLVQTVVWVGGGIVVGVAMSAGAAQLLGAMLYGIGPLDPVVFVLAPLGLLTVALLACYGPALAASDADPVEILRRD